jgi:hypothetical protein
MDSIWILFAMPMLSFLCAAFIIVRSKRATLPACVTPQSKMALHGMLKKKPRLKRERKIRWITAEQLDELVHDPTT